MANSMNDGVVVVDTTGAVAPYSKICGIKLVPAAADATLTLKSNGSNSGVVIYSSKAAANANGTFEEVEMKAGSAGFYATISGAGAVAHLYTE